MEEHCFLISYDLVAPNRNYTDLYEAIKGYGFWGRLTESTWAIISSKTAVEIRNDLLSHIDKNDRLIVVQSGRSAAWTKVMASDSWVKQYIVK